MDNKKRKLSMTSKINLIITICLMIGLIYAQFHLETHDQTKPARTADQIFQEHQKNGLAFNRAHEGKPLLFQGYVESIIEDTDDSIIVSLKPAVQLKLNMSEASAVLKLVQNDHIWVMCMGAKSTYTPKFIDCELVDGTTKNNK